MVFQSYALYPHLTVAGNLGYPLKLAGLGKAERVQRLTHVAKQLRIDALLDRKPRQLSGGQRQRVAMGRAMVRDPKVFLMDEPLSNLDAKLRVAMRAEVSELQRSLGATMFYVTHDQVEAMTMGDRVAVMDGGVLQQIATPDELYASPANMFVAGFMGSPPMNLVRFRLVTAGDGSYIAESGTAAVQLPAEVVESHRGLATVVGRDVVIGARPEHLQLGEPDDGSLHGTVRLVEVLGSEQIAHVEVPGLDFVHVEEEIADEAAHRRILVSIRDDRPRLRSGDAVGLTIRPDHLHLFDAQTGDALSIDHAVAH
jgi:multiple sugar transport system ATP-binding protein